ncbi:MAG: hypothetical protein C4340_07230, partial [Armatimonadota bacterium]
MQNVVSAAEIAPEDAKVLERAARLTYQAALRISDRRARMEMLMASDDLYEGAHARLDPQGRERIAGEYARALYQLAIAYRENSDPKWRLTMDRAVA